MFLLLVRKGSVDEKPYLLQAGRKTTLIADKHLTSKEFPRHRGAHPMQKGN